jgi:hypothetical protein
MTVYVIKFRPKPGIDAIKSLRSVLKRAGRIGLVCTDAVEKQEDETINQSSMKEKEKSS